MEENPFRPPASNRRIASTPWQIARPRTVWTSVVILAALAGLSFLLIDAPINSGWVEVVIGGMFFLCSPLAMLIVIAHREMELRNLNGKTAFYNAGKFFGSCVCFLVVGYLVFVPTCIGSAIGVLRLADIFGNSNAYFPYWLMCSVTFTLTIIACMAIRYLHGLIRKK